MKRRWFRIRWADGELARQSAVDLLDRLARTADARLAWIASSGDLALAVEVGGDAEALLVEGLHSCLPHARVVVESARNVAAFTQGLGQTFALWGPPPPSPLFPEALLALPTDAPVSAILTWRGDRFSASLFSAGRLPVAQTLAEAWPGVRVIPGWARPFLGLFSAPTVRPSQILTLPSSETFPMLASRKREERAFSSDHSRGEILLGSDAEGRAVRLQAPTRLVWVGAPERVGAAFEWMTGRWDGSVVVLDADTGRVDRAWQDDGGAAVVDWTAPGRSARVNPLMRFPDEAAAAQVRRVERWLKTLGITPDILGGRAWRGLLAVLRLMAREGAVLAPPTLLGVLRNVQAFEGNLGGSKAELPEGDRAALDAVRWSEDEQALVAAESILSRALDIPEMALWLPPYLTRERLQGGGRVIVRVPLASPAQRLYWDGLLPLLEALYAPRADCLVVALGAGSVAGRVLGWKGPCSVLAWGSSKKAAVGKREIPPEADLLAGARADPGYFETLLSVPAAILAAQDVDQAEARIRGDAGSVRLRLPPSAARATADAWRTPSGMGLPAPLGLLGGGAEDVLSALLAATLEPGQRVMVIAGRDAWPRIRRATGVESFVFLCADDVPPVNPLASPDVFSSIWWGRGLGIPADVIQDAYREGIDSAHSLLRYARKSGLGGRCGSIPPDTLVDACRSGLLGSAGPAPAGWFEGAPRLALEAENAALVRALAVVALNGGARLVLCQAPGIVRSDGPMLQRARALICPAPAWVDSVLVTPGASPDGGSLPRSVCRAAAGLEEGTALLHRRGADVKRRVHWRKRQ